MVRSTADEKVGGDVAPPEAKFETALAELEKIVQKMENGSLTLEESISAYQRGSELLKHCQNQLSEAEHKIRLLENGALRDFDPAGGNPDER